MSVLDLVLQLVSQRPSYTRGTKFRDLSVTHGTNIIRLRAQLRDAVSVHC